MVIKILVTKWNEKELSCSIIKCSYHW